MSAFGTVIAGVDGHDGGRDAVALARALQPASLRLAGVYLGSEGRPALAAVAPWDELRHSETQRMLEAARHEAGVEAELDVVAGTSPARALQELAAERGADLLVVGSSHRGKLGRVLAGDVGRGLLHGAPCPVAVAPRSYARDSPAPRAVGVAFDGSPEARAALEAAARFAAAVDGARLALFTVTPGPWTHPAAASVVIDWEQVLGEERDNARHAAEDALRAVGAEGDVHVLQGDATRLVEASAGCDVLFTGSRGWGGMKRVTLGSTSDHLVHDAHCPVIVVPRPG